VSRLAGDRGLFCHWQSFSYYLERSILGHLGLAERVAMTTMSWQVGDEGQVAAAWSTMGAGVPILKGTSQEAFVFVS
jgi:hypothetical protein